MNTGETHLGWACPHLLSSVFVDGRFYSSTTARKTMLEYSVCDVVAVVVVVAAVVEIVVDDKPEVTRIRSHYHFHPVL